MATYTAVLVADSSIPVWHEARAELPFAFAASAAAPAGAAGMPLVPPAEAAPARRLAGSMCQRWAVYKAGFQSAADPRYVVKPQRDRLREAGLAPA